MRDTAEFITWLESLDDTSGLCEVIPTEFDAEEFVRCIKGSTRLRMLESFDGHVSVVRDDDNPSDKSRQSKSFDLHTDGCYYETPPELVILYCNDPGVTDARTVLGDSIAAIDKVKGLLPVLSVLDFVYIAKSLSEIRRPLIEQHPGTGAYITNIATRGYVRPRVIAETLPDIPDVKDIVSALQQFYAAIDDSIVLNHQWRRGDLLIFDNHHYLHGRRSNGYDSQRTLSRLWVDPVRDMGIQS